MADNIFNLPSGKVQNEIKDVLQQIANTLDTSIDAVSRMSNIEELVASVIDNDITNVLNNELVATDIANKLKAKEVEYAPRLTTVESQLAQTDNKIKLIENPKLLSVIERFPNNKSPYLILHSEDNGNVLYGFAKNRYLMKTEDGGLNWEHVSELAYPIAHTYAFLKTHQGTLLYVAYNGNIYRSTDDGVTWDAVHQLDGAGNIMNRQSWCVDADNNIWFGEYKTGNQDVVRIFKSSNDGQTFEIFKTLDSTGSNDPFIRHFHTAQYDDISGRVYFCTGDGERNAGIYRTNAEGTDIEPVIVNGDSYNTDQFARAAGVCFFPDYLVWGLDSAYSRKIVRIHRSDIGKNEGELIPEILMENAPSSFFSAIKVNNEGTKWIVSTSTEGSHHDGSVQLFLLEDQGEVIRNIGSIFVDEQQGWPHVSQIGSPTDDDQIWLQSQGFAKPFSIKATLSQTKQILTVYEQHPPLLRETQNSGRVIIPRNETIEFGHTRAHGDSRFRTLYIIDGGLMREDGENGWGFLQIYNKTRDELLYETLDTSIKNRFKTYGHPYALKFDVGGWDIIVFRINQRNSALDFRGSAYVVYAWSE